MSDPGCSFTGGTPVLLADGSTLAIGSVAVGMSVVSTDPGTGVSSGQTVTGVWPHSDEVWDVTLSDGTVVESTADHPWWDASTRTWTRTDHLSVGDRLATSSGGTVAAVQDAGCTAETFNRTVSGPHT